MVLFAIIGELGSGKTLSLTFLAWKNWFYRRKMLFSNYHLYKLPYIYVDTLEKLEAMREGFFVADEFWLWVDSRTTRTKMNKVVSDILLKSRKRGLTYCFTAQLLDLLDKRVRKVLDFTAYPILNPIESVCKVSVFRTGFPKSANYLRTFYFRTGIIFTLYDHREEIEKLVSDEDRSDLKIVFQESIDTPPIFFESWEQADAHAEQYWKKNVKTLTGRV